ncbi:MAG: hypothetical protein ACK5LY_09260 [Lachnospirales bacterium]
MDILMLDKLYNNESTLIELSTAKIRGTKNKPTYSYYKIIEEIKGNEKLEKDAKRYRRSYIRLNC